MARKLNPKDFENKREYEDAKRQERRDARQKQQKREDKRSW